MTATGGLVVGSVEGRLTLSASGQAFINVATGGFGTELTVKTDEGLKDKLGGAAYFITGTVSPCSALL